MTKYVIHFLIQFNFGDKKLLSVSTPINQYSRHHSLFLIKDPRASVQWAAYQWNLA